VRIEVSLAAHKPKHDKNDQDDAENPAEPRQAIIVVRVVIRSRADATRLRPTILPAPIKPIAGSKREGRRAKPFP
jgi:hypothetical protein